MIDVSREMKGNSGYSLTTVRKGSVDPLVHLIMRHLVENCNNETQIRLQNKLHEVAEGSNFIERRLNSIEQDKEVSQIVY